MKSFFCGRGVARAPVARVSILFTALASGLATPGTAQGVSPTAAPADWLRYAEAATIAITDWLRAEAEPAQRLRAYLDATRREQREPASPLVLRIWVASDSRVSRLEFPPFAHGEANADLRGLVLGRPLPGKPPKAMRQPMIIAVQIEEGAGDASQP